MDNNIENIINDIIETSTPIENVDTNGKIVNNSTEAIFGKPSMLNTPNTDEKPRTENKVVNSEVTVEAPKVVADPLYNKAVEEVENDDVNNQVKKEPKNDTEEIPVVREAPTAEDILKNLKVDINNIDIVNPSPFDENRNMEFVLNKKTKTQIVASQSNYVAYMEGLNYKEVSALTNSTLDEYGSALLLAQTIHSKINTTTLGNLSFKEWASITSYFDIETFLYGIYLETFPGETKFNITCGKCKNNIEVNVNNDSFITGKRPETFTNVQELLANKDKAKEYLDRSILNKTKRIVLPDSKIIFDIKIPSIQKHLDTISGVNKELKDRIQNILLIMMFLDNLYMPNIKEIMNTGKAAYYKLTDKNKIAQVISKLSITDAKEISKIIESLIDENHLQYKIKSFKCTKCQEEIGDIDVDIEQLLFQQILQL